MTRHGPPITLALAVAFACKPHSVSYDPQRDDAAIAAITLQWQGGGLALSLCEDAAKAATLIAPSCSYDNIVAGGGRGTTHTESIGGCGGCPLGNTAFVRGTVSGGGLADGTAIAGEVHLGSSYDDDPYAYPYSVELQCADGSCTVSGTLDEDGTLHVTVERGTSHTGSPIDVSPVDVATCS